MYKETPKLLMISYSCATMWDAPVVTNIVQITTVLTGNRLSNEDSPTIRTIIYLIIYINYLYTAVNYFAHNGKTDYT